MKYPLLIVLFFIMIFIGCEKRPDTSTNICSDLVINYNHQSSWTGWEYNLTITYPDTLIIFERAYIPISKEKTSKYHIDKYVMDSLFQDLQKLSNINLNDNYGFGPDKPTDLPTSFFKYKNCNTADSCQIYSPDKSELPIELELFLGRIGRIVIVHNNSIKANKN
jgi:hypothetical protein